MLDDARATALLGFLIDNVDWGEGIKTKYGNYTRKQKHLGTCPRFIHDEVVRAIAQSTPIGDIHNVKSIYMNYYTSGDDYCPKHRHLGTNQMILSLGTSRNIHLSDAADGSKNTFTLDNGSVLLFSSEYHEIRKQKRANGPRISIVVFY